MAITITVTEDGLLVVSKCYAKWVNGDAIHDTELDICLEILPLLENFTRDLGPHFSSFVKNY